MKQGVYWHSLRAPHAPRRLSGEVTAEVVVVGAGMAGLTCAHRLRASGISVTLVERDFCGAGASGLSSGFITPDSEIALSSLLARYGLDEARRVWEFVVSGVDVIRANIRDYAIDCDLQLQDSLFVADAGFRSELPRLEHEARTKLGFASRLYGTGDIREVLGTSGYTEAVRYDQTYSIDPYAYCQALRDVLEAQGVVIYEDARVTAVRRDGVETASGAVRADRVVVCTDRFIPELGALDREIYHVQTFLGMSSPLPEDQLRRIFPDDRTMTWDSALIYNYFRVAGGDRLLLGGGDLLHTYARAPLANLEAFALRALAYMRSRFPGVEIELEFVWPGMLGVSKDLLPVMGADPRHDSIWYAGAAAGLPWAAALGVYAAERIVGNRNDFDERFSPHRTFSIGGSAQTLLTTPLTFAISNGIAKYR